MSDVPASADPGQPWQRNCSGEGLSATTARPQPPLREVLKGLDVRELEGDTVFDQFFALLPRGTR